MAVSVPNSGVQSPDLAQHVAFQQQLVVGDPLPGPSSGEGSSNATGGVSARKRGRVPFLPKCRRCGEGTLKGNQLMPCPQKKHTIHRLCINSKEGYPAKDCDCPPDETIGKVMKATRKRKVKKDETALVPTTEVDGVTTSTSSYLSHLDATTATFFSTGMFYLQLPCPVFRNEINVALYQLQMARGVEDPTVLAVPAYLLNTQPNFTTQSAWHRQPPM